MTEDRTIKQIKINLDGIGRITGVKLRYRKFPRDWAPKRYGAERWYKENEWVISGRLYQTARELWVATEHWWTMACEIECDQIAKENNAREAHWKKLEKEGHDLGKRADEIEAKFLSELKE